MFTGSIPQGARQIVQQVLGSWRDVPLWVGTSGNFTVERIAAAVGVASIRGNDVSLYSCALGAYLAGRQVPVAVKDPAWQWLTDYMADAEGVIATLLLMTKVGEFGEQQTIYHKRMYDGYRRSWDDLYAQTVERVRAIREQVHLDDFFAGDVVDFAQAAPPEVAFITYPPTYAGGYERLYRFIDSVFDWDKPSYQLFDAGRIAALVSAVTAREHWMLAWRERLEGLPLIGYVRNSLRSIPTYIHGSQSAAYVISPTFKLTPPKVQRLGPDDEIQGPLAVCPLGGEAFEALRAEYLSHKIVPARPSLLYAVSAGGALVGALGLSPPVGLGDVYLTSDFAVRPTRYRRLSKLVLVALVSQEMRDLLQTAVGKRLDTVGTTAFTDKPVSMKYRGIFDLHSRKEGRVNYLANLGRWTLEEGFSWWLQHHSA